MYTDNELNKLYEQRVKDIKESHEREIFLLKERITSLEDDKFWFKCVACITSALLVFILIICNAH